MMWILLLWNTALAASVDGGVQIGLFDAGLDFIEERYQDQEFFVNEPEVAAENVSCYSRVGIQNFNANVPIQSIDLSMGSDHLVIDILFGTIEGSNMVIFGEDDEFLDLCPRFETNFNSFSLENARVLVEVIPTASTASFDIEISGTPNVSGDLTTDIDWIPDQLVDGFVEDTIFARIEEIILERVPEIASTVLGPSLYAGEVGDVGMDVTLTDIHTDRKGLLVGIDVEAEWLGEGCPVSGVVSEAIGLSPTIDFDNGDGAAIGVAITELQINRLFFEAWKGGLLCFDEGPLSRFSDAIEDAVNSTVSDGEVSIVFPHNPVFYIEDDRANLSIDNVLLAMNGNVDGADAELVQMEVNLTLGAELRIEREISSFVFTLTNVDMTVLDFQADALLRDSAAVADNLKTLLEGWVSDTLVQRIEGVPIYGNLFHVSDIFLRVTEMELAEGVVVLTGALYNSDDPLVDSEAPDTIASIESANTAFVNVTWEAEDDNNGPFAYAWRINNGAWSAWTSDTSGKIPTPDSGTHEIQVRARDDWLNVDTSPYTLLFEVTPNDPAPEKGCQCATSARPTTTWLWTILLVLMGTLRRRE